MTVSLNWPVAALAGAALLTGAASASDKIPPAALINESPSLPRGAYARVPGGQVEPGSIVAIPQPPSTRPYLESLGMPANNLLLKRVAAVGGESVCVRDGLVETPRRRVMARIRDRRGVGLPAWRGCRVLVRDELFLLGDTPGSYDSRYFGPVSRRNVAGVYREVVTW
ncbi:S26 family signal peptidase [Brevundimonas sp. NPDC092305]|uniref:S26 family signal peptidase n=1 Tax=Brevundimonas sp. NPDC092305 TaxID=3363957 RepID=UPI003827BC44